MRYKSLILPDGHLGPAAKPKRDASVREAVEWPKGQKGALVYTPVYAFDSSGYTVGVEKPGKEAFEKLPNPNDMLPTVYQEGRRWKYTPSFFDLYQEFEDLRNTNRTAMELIACLLYRSSFMIDHLEKDGVWRWAPPEDVMTELEGSISEIASLPPTVFLHLVEVLALQEDTKYWTRAGGKIQGGTGRTNNLQTCTYLLAALLGKVRIMEFAGALSRTGVAFMAQYKARELFPLLRSS